MVFHGTFELPLSFTNYHSSISGCRGPISTMKPIPSLEIYLRRTTSGIIDAETQLGELFAFTQRIGSFSPLLQNWFLATGNSEPEARMYEAFDRGGPSHAALAVVRTASKGMNDIRSISIWNGAELSAESAGMTSRVNSLDRPDTIELRLRLAPQVADWKIPVDWLKFAVPIWRPKCATFAPYWYNEKKVFKDRPGAGWMVYLPVVLTSKQVPEARALIPVIGEKNRPIGTIVVSVIDEQFSDENPDHVRAANAIEIRLVDLDILPRFSDL